MSAVGEDGQAHVFHLVPGSFEYVVRSPAQVS